MKNGVDIIKHTQHILANQYCKGISFYNVYLYQKSIANIMLDNETRLEAFSLKLK